MCSDERPDSLACLILVEKKLPKMILIVLLVFTLLALILYSWFNIIYDVKKMSLPGPFPLPLLGNGHMFMGDSTDFLNALQNLSNTYGGALHFHILSNRYLLISDPKYIEAITSSNELITKGRSYNYLHPWLGQGLLTSTGQRWKKHRKFLTPAFHFNILQNFLPIFLKNEKVLIHKLRSLADGRDIELFSIIALAALDNVTESIMGVSFNAQQDSQSRYVKTIETLSTLVTARMHNPLLYLEAIFKRLPQKKIHDDAVDTLHGHSRRVIEKRRQELKNLNVTSLNYDSEHGIKNRHAFLDLLLLAELDGAKIDDETVREQVDTFMFEGHDTTTSSVSYCLYCIAKYKDVQEKVFEEQKLILGDDIYRDPQYKELQQMKYLELVIKESLRIFPAVPLIERWIERDTELAGLFIPKNTSLLINIFQMQRNPLIFENPMEFRPERFEDSAINPFTWLAFSAGPRNCIGQKFAIMEMKVILAGIIRNFRLSSSDKEPIPGADLVLRSRNGVHVKLTPR